MIMAEATYSQVHRNDHDTGTHEPYPETSSPGRAVAAFVLGIASIVLCGAPFMLIAAIVGLLLEKESERTGSHTLQLPAKILCIIGIVLCSLVIVGILFVILVLGVLSR